LLVNDRVDVALAARVDGAHLGERSLPVDLARELLGAQRMVGASVHGRDALVAVTDAGASFAFLGMVFPSASHPGRTGVGIGGFSAILDEGQPIPVLGIGGIDTARVGAVLKAGAHGVAVLSGIWERSDPASAVLDYLAALDTVQDQPSGFAKRREAMEETR
jgi:thiamine-phosphate diphosphorylase